MNFWLTHVGKIGYIHDLMNKKLVKKKQVAYRFTYIVNTFTHNFTLSSESAFCFSWKIFAFWMNMMVECASLVAMIEWCLCWAITASSTLAITINSNSDALSLSRPESKGKGKGKGKGFKFWSQAEMKYVIYLCHLTTLHLFLRSTLCLNCIDYPIIFHTTTLLRDNSNDKHNTHFSYNFFLPTPLGYCFNMTRLKEEKERNYENHRPTTPYNYANILVWFTNRLGQATRRLDLTYLYRTSYFLWWFRLQEPAYGLQPRSSFPSHAPAQVCYHQSLSLLRASLPRKASSLLLGQTPKKSLI